MLEKIKTYKFIKGKNGLFKTIKNSDNNLNIEPNTKSNTKSNNKLISKSGKKPQFKFKKGIQKEVIPDCNDDDDDDDDNYISYDDICKKLKQQKKCNKSDINIFQSDIIKTNYLPVNKNKFIIHQYSFNDKRNKIHKDLQNQLMKLVQKGFLTNHLLFYGLSGSGKYTLGLYILYDIYGGCINERHVKTQTINKRDIKYIDNQYYMEILINNYVINDHHTLGIFINKNTKNKRTGLCQYIIIKHFDQLTPECQKTIYNVMEKHSHLRFILTTRHLSKIIPNIKSKTSQIRVPRPDGKLLAKYINRISKSNDINITHGQIEYIVRSAECNISQSLTTMELCIHEGNYIKTKDAHLKYIANILQVATGPSICNIRDVRDLVSKLIISTYDVSEVYRTCVKLFLNSNYDINIKQQVIEIANKYSQLNNTTHNTIFIMEAFFLHIMRIINNVTIKKNYSLQKISKKN
jgi:DNA polymerase III delta prime subunit